jgi:uncharacterized protein YjbI with pentapeptide repeats
MGRRLKLELFFCVFFTGLAIVILGVVIVDSPGFRWSITLTATVVAILVASFSAFFLVRSRVDNLVQIGLAVIPGILFLIGSLLIQAAVDLNSFRSSIALTSDLSGFDPQGRSLNGLNFAKKKLHVANLRKASLVRARLREAELIAADLSEANLQKADLFYARLFNAGVIGANFSGANLEGAELATTGLETARLDGARVHEATCWEVGVETSKGKAIPPTPTPTGRMLLEHLKAAHLRTEFSGGPLGHICTTKGDLDIAHKRSEYFLICENPPHLRTKAMMIRQAKGLACSV